VERKFLHRPAKVSRKIKLNAYLYTLATKGVVIADLRNVLPEDPEIHCLYYLGRVFFYLLAEKT
jgi:hypothetical protein